MTPIEISSSSKIDSTHLRQLIEDAESYYQKDVTKKTFNEFFAHKYKCESKKMAIPQCRRAQEKKAHQDYAQLFQKCLNKEFESIWQLYNNSYRGGTLGSDEKGLLILGNSSQLKEPEMLRNFKVLSDKKAEAGSIFQGKWSLLRNDVMILGTIHSGKTCMIYSPIFSLKDFSLFWNAKENRPTMLSREIAILKAAGYERRDHELGTGFVSTDPKKAARLTLNDACAAADNIDDLEILKTSLF